MAFFVPFRLQLAALLLAGLPVIAPGQTRAVLDDAAETRNALGEAKSQAETAKRRAEVLEGEAAGATLAVEKTAREAVAVAARIQQAEAEIATEEANLRLIDRQRAQLRARLSERQRPLLRLTAALQRLSRRPLMVALLRPGSVRDAMHMRALLETMLPEVARRTAALRAEIARAHVLHQQALAVEQALKGETANLNARRATLATLETRQRLAARDVSGSADREAERALALAEQARDLGVLVTELDKSASLREQLARLPGPVMRPARPAQAQVGPQEVTPSGPALLAGYMLPVSGRLVSGFADTSRGSAPSRGLSIVARAGAQVVAPAAGRVSFAGPYPGFGQIVIISHLGGWTSLITGLAQVDARVGDNLLAGAPLGIAGPGRPVLNLELRKDGQPVNPLDQLRRQ